MNSPRERTPKHRSESPLSTLRRIPRSALPAETVALARYLLGMLVVSDAPEGRAVARIVETEAYLAGDPAAHSFNGCTPRNASMFLRRGHAYVYFIYGSCFCLNVSSETPGIGAAVLLRAAEPAGGIALMRARRPLVRERDLCRGPGRLAAALGVTRLHDGLDLAAPGALWLAAGHAPAAIATSTRIGLTKAADRPLRFFVAGDPFVSGPARRNAAALTTR